METGEADSVAIQRTLSEYSSLGWKLHSMMANEIGKTSVGIAVLLLGTSVNATIEQTILVFERCIKA